MARRPTPITLSDEEEAELERLIAECERNLPLIDRPAVELLHELAPAVRAAAGDQRLTDAGKILSAQSSAGGLDVGLQIIARTLGIKQALSVAERLGHEWHTGAAAAPPVRIEIRRPSD